jgi:hypothetical protein
MLGYCMTGTHNEHNHKYFEEQVGHIAFVFLANLLHFNLDSRRYMATAVLNAVYKPLESRQGELANLSEELRRQLMDVSTLDILAKAFMAIEDLGKILLTSGKAIKEIPDTILGAGQDDSFKAIAKYSALAERDLYELFPFLHRKAYGLEGDEAQAVEQYWEQNSAAFKRTLVFVSRFIDRHAWAYNKYKHGIPIILAMKPSGPLPAGINGAVPIFTTTADLPDVKMILTGDLIADKLIGFTGSVVDFSKALVERRLQMAELGGVPPPLLTHVNEASGIATYESWGLGKFDMVTEEKFNSAFQRVMTRMNRTRIEATLNFKIDEQKLHELINFYTQPWRIA